MIWLFGKVNYPFLATGQLLIFALFSKKYRYLQDVPCNNLYKPGLRSRIPNNTDSRSRIFLSDSGSGSRIGSFLHHTPKLGILVEVVQFLLKRLLKYRFLAVHHGFH